MKIEIFGVHPDTSCWHVLVDEGTVGYIQGLPWKFSWVTRSYAYDDFTPTQRAEICAVADQKATLLNITHRLLK